MPTLGSTAKPTTAQEAWGLNSKNQHASLLTMPAGGPWLISHVGGWFAGWNDSGAARVSIWNSGGTHLRSSNSFTVASAGDITLGDAFEYYYALTSPLEVAGGTQLYVGFCRSASVNVQFPVTGSGTHIENAVGSVPASLSGFSSHAGTLGVYLSYAASNALPTAPTLTSPANGATLTDFTPTLDWSHNDPDGDAQTSYDLQVSTDSDFSSVTHWNTGATTSSTSVTYAGTALTRGTTYYWRVRTADAEGDGPWSSPRNFRINRLPTVTKVAPASAALAYIHNLGTNTNTWTQAGSWARPRVDWTFSDPDGGSQSRYQVKIWAASSGGSPLYDSGEVASSATMLDVPWAGVYDTTYWWSVRVRDATGEWDAGGEARSAFKMLWSQAIYEYAVSGGASSSAWAFSSGSKVESVGILFRTATGAGGTGASAWKTAIGQLTPAAYLNVMVRLATDTSGTKGSLADMTFSYTAAAIQPERWEFSTPTTDWLIDRDVRRFGSQSLRLKRSATTGDRWAAPYTKALGDGVSCSPNTEYTVSVYVNTAGGTLASPIQLRIIEPVIGSELTDLYLDSSNKSTTNTDDHPDGWQRLWIRFRTEAQSVLYPVLWQPAAGSSTSDQVWVDAMQLEESIMPTPWRPGLVGDAAILDVGGIVVDATAGGIFRLRGSAGAARDIVELGTSGLMFGGDAQLYSPAANEIRAAAGSTLAGDAAGRIITRTAAQTIATSTYAVISGSWNATLWAGALASFDGTDELVVSRGGLWMGIAKAVFVSNATGVRFVGFSVNDTSSSALSVNRQARLPVTTDTNTDYGWAMIPLVLAENDRVCLKVWQNSGGNLDASDFLFGLLFVGY